MKHHGIDWVVVREMVSWVANVILAITLCLACVGLVALPIWLWTGNHEFGLSVGLVVLFLVFVAVMVYLDKVDQRRSTAKWCADTSGMRLVDRSECESFDAEQTP